MKSEVRAPVSRGPDFSTGLKKTGGGGWGDRFTSREELTIEFGRGKIEHARVVDRIDDHQSQIVAECQQIVCRTDRHASYMPRRFSTRWGAAGEKLANQCGL